MPPKTRQQVPAKGKAVATRGAGKRKPVGKGKKDAQKRARTIVLDTANDQAVQPQSGGDGMLQDEAGTSGQYLDSNLLLRPVVGQDQPLLPESNVAPIEHQNNACTVSGQSDSPVGGRLPVAVGMHGEAPHSGTSPRFGAMMLDPSASQLDTFTAPAGAHIPLSLKEKIWRGEYVEFSDLLPQNRAFVVYQELNKNSCCHGGHCCVGNNTRPAVSKNEIHTIGEWTDALLIYMHIYLERFPSECLPLVKYTTIVRQAATRFTTKGAILYDKEFRMKMALYPQKPFNVIDGELYYSVLIPSVFHTGQRPTFVGKQQFGGNFNAGESNPKPPFLPAHSANNLPRGVCWSFNKGGCNKQNCKFVHKCATCNRTNHPQTKCFYERSAGHDVFYNA